MSDSTDAKLKFRSSVRIRNIKPTEEKLCKLF